MKHKDLSMRAWWALRDFHDRRKDEKQKSTTPAGFEVKRG